MEPSRKRNVSTTGNRLVLQLRPCLSLPQSFAYRCFIETFPPPLSLLPFLEASRAIIAGSRCRHSDGGVWNQSAVEPGNRHLKGSSQPENSNVISGASGWAVLQFGGGT